MSHSWSKTGGRHKLSTASQVHRPRKDRPGAPRHDTLCLRDMVTGSALHLFSLHGDVGGLPPTQAYLLPSAQQVPTCRERSLARGLRSQTIHLAGDRASAEACVISLGSTHSTAVKGRSSTRTRTGRVLPPTCTQGSRGQRPGCWYDVAVLFQRASIEVSQILTLPDCVTFHARGMGQDVRAPAQVLCPWCHPQRGVLMNTNTLQLCHAQQGAQLEQAMAGWRGSCYKASLKTLVASTAKGQLACVPLWACQLLQTMPSRPMAGSVSTQRCQWGLLTAQISEGAPRSSTRM